MSQLPLRKSWKKLFTGFGGQIFLGILIASYIHLVYLTSRVRRQVHPAAAEYVRGEKPAIFAFWHGRMLLMPAFSPRNRAMWVMISHHRDGQWIARAMRAFRFGTVRGSSRKGGHGALRNALNRLQAGENIAITPDGPRGPFEVAQPGAIGLAALSGLPVVPVSFAGNLRWHARSWDRFLLIFPFARLGLAVNAPIFVESTADEKAQALATQHLTERLRDATRQAEWLALPKAKRLQAGG